MVFLFNGLTLPFEGVAGTGTDRLAQNIRQAGVRAEINRPSAWPEVADNLLRHAPVEQGPIAVYGYSYGAQAALRFARRLGQAGVPVQTLVALEAYSPVPVPCNVREAIHIYVSGAALIPVTPLVSERPGCTRLQNVRFVPQGPAPFWLDHWSISTLDELHRSVQGKILDGNRVRLREETPRSGSP